jgi:hypothetical protein
VVVQSLIALGLATALGLSAGAPRPVTAAAGALLVLGIAYLACVLGGRMGAARLIGVLAAVAALAALVVEARELHPSGGVGLGLLSAAAGAGLIGSVLLAMLLGHAYLNIPGLPIAHLRRLGWMLATFVAARFLAVGLAAKVLVGTEAAAGRLPDGLDAEAILRSNLPLLAMRIGLGVVIPAILAVMVDRTARIRSTQSATGLLYVALVFVLFGELIASYLWTASGLPA